MSGRAEAVRTAAFFDLDGTLLAGPPLERRFYGLLRERGEIGAKQIAGWLAEAARLAPRGLFALRHGNKMYLRGVRADAAAALRSEFFSAAVAAEDGAGFNAAAPFFPEGMERLAWHAREGHALVLVSGTLEPLAVLAAGALEGALRAQGCRAVVRVCATRLEESGGRWTGRIAGEPLAGAAKGRAVERLAEREGFCLDCSYAYGNSHEDRFLLGAVGRPLAINPARQLGLLARRAGWPILRWDGSGAQRRDRAAAARVDEATKVTKSLWEPNV